MPHASACFAYHVVQTRRGRWIALDTFRIGTTHAPSKKVARMFSIFFGEGASRVVGLFSATFAHFSATLARFLPDCAKTSNRAEVEIAVRGMSKTYSPTWTNRPQVGVNSNMRLTHTL